VEAGTFRLDLYYRLAGVTLEIPPLRERRARIVPLARALLAAAAARDGRPVPAMSIAAIARLGSHDWPGNVRELRNVLERALILAGDAIGPEHVVFDQPCARAPGPEPRPVAGRAWPAIAVHEAGEAGEAGVAGEASEASERRRILDALERSCGNQTRAAKLLGISRSTLATKLAIHRLPRPRK
ncbi:MAG TPA: helix-turn-helix domain-containing protein, partial [Kofleriaceae bacterium]|nr:helix-turn-helix domain-containing protein [Kofleriaceae bacterium]